MILDTNAVSALFAGDPALDAVLAAETRLRLPVTVLGEYRYGLLRSRHRAQLQSLLESLIRESVVLVIDEATAAIYSTLREELRSKGRPIPENDVWIASLARQHRQPVVTRDAHFDEVEGLRRVSW